MFTPHEQFSLYHSMDWELLRRQKLRLSEVIQGINLFDPETPDLLEGLITLLDNLQDDAESKGYPVFGWEEV